MSDDEMNKLMEEQAKLQDKIDAVDGWELERKLEIAADALRLPPWDARHRQALRRREAPRRAVPPAAVEAGHAAARRTHQPPGRRIGRLARAFPATNTRAPSSRSPTTATFSTTSPSGFSNSTAATASPGKGNYSSWLDQKEQRLAQEERAAGRAREDARSASSSGCAPTPRRARPSPRRVCSAYEELASQEFQKRNETNEIYIPPGDRLGDLVIECKDVRKGFGDRLLIDKPRASTCRRAASSASSARTAPARPRCFAC